MTACHTHTISVHTFYSGLSGGISAWYLVYHPQNYYLLSESVLKETWNSSSLVCIGYNFHWSLSIFKTLYWSWSRFGHAWVNFEQCYSFPPFFLFFCTWLYAASALSHKSVFPQHKPPDLSLHRHIGFTSLLKDCCISGKMLDMSDGGPVLVPPPPPGPGPGPFPPPGPGPDVLADTEPGTGGNNKVKISTTPGWQD